MEQELYMTIIDWVEDSNQSVWNICIKFDTWNNIEKYTVIIKKLFREIHINRESNILEFKIYLFICYEHEDPSSCNTTVYLS